MKEINPVTFTTGDMNKDLMDFRPKAAGESDPKERKRYSAPEPVQESIPEQNQSNPGSPEKDSEDLNSGKNPSSPQPISQPVPPVTTASAEKVVNVSLPTDPK